MLYLSLFPIKLSGVNNIFGNIATKESYFIFSAMLKFIVGAALLIQVLVVFGVAALVAQANSEKFASDMVFLRCERPFSSGGTWDQVKINKVLKNQDRVLVGRLRKDWIKGVVLLNWVASDGVKKTGLYDTLRLEIKTDKYTGYSAVGNHSRSFDRETLVYTLEKKMFNADTEALYWLKRKCIVSTDELFDRLRKKSANVTKTKKKI